MSSHLFQAFSLMILNAPSLHLLNITFDISHNRGLKSNHAFQSLKTNLLESSAVYEIWTFLPIRAIKAVHIQKSVAHQPIPIIFSPYQISSSNSSSNACTLTVIKKRSRVYILRIPTSNLGNFVEFPILCRPMPVEQKMDEVSHKLLDHSRIFSAGLKWRAPQQCFVDSKTITRNQTIREKA